MVVGPQGGAYAPRNAINAEAVKAAIDARSKARGDPDPVRAWLVNHLFRHAVSNIAAVSVTSAAQARDLLGAEPAWLAARLDAPGPVPIVWVDPIGPELLEVEAQVLEFLRSRGGTRLDGKLELVNCPHALAAWAVEHERMAEYMRRGWRRSHPQALRQVCATPHGHLVELIPGNPALRDEMAYESYSMGHCLGVFADTTRLRGGYGENYAHAVHAGDLRLFSLRDHRGEPHVTMSLLTGQGNLRVDQVKGKQNRPPVAKYRDDVVVSLNVLGVQADEQPEDCANMGIVFGPTGWQPVAAIDDPETLARLIARDPQLYTHLNGCPPLVEWLVAMFE